jgi:hypothetical protein
MAFFGKLHIRRNPDAARIVLLVSALFGAAVFAAAASCAKNVSGATLMYEAICRELMNNTMEGRQALVSSAWWPPLPVLLMIPFVALQAPGSCPLASFLVSALFGAAALYVFERTLRDCMLGWSRFPMVLALAANPFFLDACINGSSQTTVMFFAVLVAHSLVQWVMFGKLRFLVHLGIGSALLLTANFEMIIWLLVVFALLTVDVIRSEESRQKKEAILILALLPTAYTLGLWFLMNRLIMGDALYFARSFLSVFHAPAARSVAVVEIPFAHYLTCWVSVVALVVSIVRKNRDGVFMGMMAIAPMVLALFLASRGALQSSPILYCMYPLAVLAVAYSAEKQGPDLHLPEIGTAPLVGPYLLSLVPIALTVVTIAMSRGAVAAAAGLSEQAEVTRLSRDRKEVLPSIARDVMSRSRYSKVYVCGYDSLLMVGPDANPLFVRSLDFNFDKAKSDYPGYALYVLVHRPAERSAMESVHWKYAGIYNFGGTGALYDSDWGDWRLFEIIQAEGSDKI